MNSAAFDEERFISEFIAPDRLWFRDFEALPRQRRGAGGVPTAFVGTASGALGTRSPS